MTPLCFGLIIRQRIKPLKFSTQISWSLNFLYTNYLLSNWSLLSCMTIPSSMLSLGKDSWICNWDKNGIFTIKFFYSFLNDESQMFFEQNSLEVYLPLKIKIFIWLTWDNKILTLDNLARCSYNFISTPMHVFCHQSLETTDHLFFLCKFTIRIWKILCAFQYPRHSSYMFGWGSEER